jgi:hypothetical protein
MEAARISVAEIRDNALFKNVKRTHAAAIAGIAMRMRYEPNTVIVRADTIPKRLVIVCHGMLVRYFSNDSHIIPVEHLHRGSLWGHRMLVTPALYTPQIVRAGANGVETIEVPIVKLLKLFEQSSELSTTVAHSLLKILAQLKTEDDETLGCIYGIGHILQGVGSVSDKCNAALHLACETLAAQTGFIASFDTTAHRSFIIAHNGSPSLTGSSRSMLSDTILATVFTTRTSLVLGPHTVERKHQSMPYFRPTMMLVPMIAHTTVIGALALTDASRRGGFSTRDVELLNVIGSMLTPLLMERQQSDHSTQHDLIKRAYIGSLHHLE